MKYFFYVFVILLSGGVLAFGFSYLFSSDNLTITTAAQNKFGDTVIQNPPDGRLGMYVNSVADTYNEMQTHADRLRFAIVSPQYLDEQASEATVRIVIQHKDAAAFFRWLQLLTTDGNVTGYKSVFPIDEIVPDDVQQHINIFITDVDIL